MRAIWLVMAGFIVAISLGQGALATPNPPIQLRVMTFNIWYGGEQVSLPTVVEAIRRADPDIVGIQEPDGNLARIAAAAGYAYIDPRRNIISRYPIFDSGVGERTENGPMPYGVLALDSNALHAWVMVRPGQVVAVDNTHLSSDPYGPEAVRDGAPLADVLALETRVRLPEAQPLTALGALGRSGVPVFLTGDFNSPSYLDWTAAMQVARPTVIHYPVVWPVSRALADSGLRDSYREIYTDPVVRHGFTWTAGMPNPFVRPRETIDRIDFIWTAGPVKTVASQIVGEVGGPDVDIGISPWPSDHRSVVSTFEVTPIDAPALVAVEPRRVVRGQDFLVRGHVPGSETWSVLLVARGATAASSRLGLVGEIEPWRRAAHFASVGLAAGEYDAVLLDAANKELKRARFVVVDPDAAAQVSVAASHVQAGDPLHVSWANAPGNRFDWIGIYKASDPNVADTLASAYTDAHFTGRMDISLKTKDGALPPGQYEVRLMRDDTFAVLAVAPFTIDGR